jgi:hypothetical protein
VSTVNKDFGNAITDLEEVYGQLYLYIRSTINSFDWYIKLDGESTIKGKQIHDYVMDAIEYHLRNPSKFDASRGDLMKYLQYSVIRNLMRPDARGAENRKSRDLLAEQLRLEDDNETYVESIYPLIENTLTDELDLGSILAEMEKEVEGDSELENIFLGICVYSMSREEIMDEFNLSDKDYLNAYRRLGTVRKRVQKKFHMKKKES